MDNLKYITSSKLFSTVFDSEMKSRGFKRKGHLYYRLVGEIMQGVVLKTTNPFEICAHAFPMWSKPSYFYSLGPWIENKGYWAERGMSVDPAYLFGGYYRKENVELNFEAMEFCLEVVKEYVLPILDDITDVNSYIEYKRKRLNNDTLTNLRSIRLYEPRFAVKYKDIVYNPTCDVRCANVDIIDAYAFLYRAYQENDYAKVYDELKEYANDYYAYDIRGQEKMLALYEKIMNLGDLSWIESYRKERLQFIVPILKRDFNIDFEIDF